MLNWFNATVYAAVIYVVSLSVAETLRGSPFEPFTLAGAVFLLLTLPILFKLATRRR